MESTNLGYRHVQWLARDWHNNSNRFDDVGEGLWAAYDSETRLIGVVGLNQDPFALDGQVGRVRRLYILEQWRGKGIGRRLLSCVEQEAQQYFERLVANANSGAFGFFEGLGFVPTPTAKHWTHHKLLVRF